MPRCKVGDLAIIVGSACGNEGAIVRCVNFVKYDRYLENGRVVEGVDVWECKGRIPNPQTPDQANGKLFIHDRRLRPIRDPGDDAVSEDVRPIPAALVRDIVERNKARRESGVSWI